LIGFQDITRVFIKYMNFIYVCEFRKSFIKNVLLFIALHISHLDS